LESILTAILSAFAWGVSDYGAGIKTRRLSALVVTGAMLGTGGLLAALGLVIWDVEQLLTRTLLLGAMAGVLTVLGLTTLYWALGAGRMSIVAPISATGVVIPVAADLLGGQELGWAQLAGIVLALAGMLVIVSSAEGEEGESGRSSFAPIAVAIVSAIGLGVFYLVSAEVDEGQVLWFVTFAQLLAAAILAVLATFTRAVLPSRADARQLFGLGVLSLAAWLLATVALTSGPLSISSTITALYPVVTVLLAIRLQGERPGPLHVAALCAIFLGVAGIAAG